MMRYLVGDCREVLRGLPAQSAQCCVTSPPYYGLRDYGVAGQIGLEPTPDEYVAQMVAVFREVRRALRDDGTLWLNVGDSYSRSPAKGGSGTPNGRNLPAMQYRGAGLGGAKEKDLLGIPWMLAFALRADGWHLRSDIIWHKPNPMPESVRDRPTSAHEHVFLLSKQATYFYDSDAIRQPLSNASYSRLAQDIDGQAGSARANGGTRAGRPLKAVRFGGNKGQGEHGSAARRASGNQWEPATETANARNVWSITTRPYKGAHFATMPPELAERCIKAGSRVGDMVLDPFGGAGTTGMAADRLGRSSVLIDLSAEYAALAEKRLAEDRVARLPPALRRLI